MQPTAWGCVNNVNPHRSTTAARDKHLLYVWRSANAQRQTATVPENSSASFMSQEVGVSHVHSL
ncbi:hypothetical protein K523DRAFT_325622 [Schizophyllum commune Tattone D]|nr:hypothetical protein K523DRAFT_325622 [Schizophyllum commune Tattone D]